MMDIQMTLDVVIALGTIVCATDAVRHLISGILPEPPPPQEEHEE